MKKLFICMLSIFTLLAHSQEAPMGAPAQISPEEQQNLDAIKGKVQGIIVWSTSRDNSKHNIWKMNADGTDKQALTQSDAVDWFPRLNADGSKVLFTRSKSGWVPETDAKFNDKWDLFIINIDGTQETKVAENATWGTWRPDGQSIVFARGTKAFSKNLATGAETLLLDGDVSIKQGTIVQNPNLSPDGNYLAATLRGTSRETGIWDIPNQKWTTSGAGCQIDWYPDGNKIYRMNPTGNGGTAAPSEVLHFEFKNGKQVGKVGFLGPAKTNKLMDLPGRRSHEYFPKIDQTGKYLVWCATDKGHDHDIYDYEVYLWKLGDPVEKAVRLTFHTGNDRWPDFIVK
jgi:hypothetical protein